MYIVRDICVDLGFVSFFHIESIHLQEQEATKCVQVPRDF